MMYTKLSPKQLQAMLWWSQPDTRNHDAIVCDGSVRSGKTMSMTVGFVLWSMKNFNNENFAFCGKTIDSLKRNVITPMQKWLEGVVEIKVNLSRNFLDITMCGHSNRYYFFGGKDESSYQLIQGITLAGVLLDEVALMPKSFVEQALARCSVTGSKLWFNCNPDSSEHWFFKEWVDENSEKTQQKNRLHLHFTMDDNFSLSDEVKQRYERMYSGVFYDRYIKGLWVLAEGIVYPMFDKSRHIIKNYIPLNQVFYYISCDYGTLNPCSMGLWALENNRAVRLKEYYYNGRGENTQKTDEEYYSELEKLADGYQIQHIIVDPSAASFITTIKKHGKFRVRKADNKVIDGIRNTMTLIKNDKLFFCECCKDIIREFSLYRWNDKAGKEDTVIKENDHAMDDMRYFVNTAMGRVLKEIYRKGGRE